jgi:hypothetical protein
MAICSGKFIVFIFYQTAKAKSKKILFDLSGTTAQRRLQKSQTSPMEEAVAFLILLETLGGLLR